MHKLINFHRLLNTLSVDVAFGAVVSAYFMADIANVKISFLVSTCLGLTVWLIYTVDHLLDARKIEAPASTHRHRFHQVHFRILLGCVCLVFLFILFLLPDMQKPILVRGAVLILFVILYLFFQRRIGFLKEFFGAVLYSGGVLLPTMAIKNISFINLFQVLPILMFVITTVINLILFSWFDREKDKIHDHTSLVSGLGELGTKVLLYFLFLIQLVLASYCLLIMSQSTPFVMVLLVMNVTLLIIFLKWRWFSKSDKYRLAGDAVFLFPLFLFWF